MAKPRVFISSTFYDLRHVRADLETFIKSLGYEAIRNEDGKIPYGKDEPLEDYCYKEIQSVDILISIIGGRFGTEAKTIDSSISQQELKTALKEGKQIYMFVDKNVAAEYETYLLNKNKDLSYRFVNDVRIYKFIEEVKSLPFNNNIKEFESSNEIIKYLKEQFAGLFQKFLQEQKRFKEVNLIKNLENTTKNLDQLVTYLSEENKGKSAEINSILMINHPFLSNLSEELGIEYKFYIENFNDLINLLSSRNFQQIGNVYTEDFGDYFQWTKITSKDEQTLLISFHLFDDDQKLKFFKKGEWDNSYLRLTIVLKDDELPF